MRRKCFYACKFAVAMAVLLSVCGGCGKADKLYGKGMEYMEDGDYSEAAKQFQGALEEDSDEVKYHIGYGMALVYSGSYEESLEEFVKGSEGKPSDGENKQIYYGQAVAYYGIGEYESAVSSAEKALEIKDKSGLDSAVRNIQAAAYELLGDGDSALALYEENIKEDGKDSDSYLKSGRLQLSRGQYEAATEDFNKALETDKNCYDAFYGKYDVCMAKGDADAANGVLTELTEMETDSAESYIAVGRAYYLMGKLDEAKECYDKAGEKDSPVVPYYQGLLLMRSGKYDDAVKSFKSFLENESQGDVLPAQAYNQIAGCLIEQNKYMESIDYLNKGLSYGRTPVHKSLLKNLVVACEKTGSYKKARKNAKEYLVVYPNDTGMAKELDFIRTRIKK